LPMPFDQHDEVMFRLSEWGCLVDRS
jgi:hypothetical protein